MKKPRILNKEKLKANVNNSSYSRINDGKLNGAHIIVKQNGETIINSVLGYKSACGEPLAGNEVYRIASMTKPITALALLIEHDRGHLNIYDDLDKYLPSFSELYVAERNENGEIINRKNTDEKLKLYQLVSHSNGIVELSDEFLNSGKCNIRTAVDYLSKQPLIFEPGKNEAYSTGAFDIAARVIEITSGIDFDSYLNKNIFDKLLMKDTVFEPDDEQWKRMVTVHDRDKNGNNIDVIQKNNYVMGNFPLSYHAAGAALASTAEDYSRFAEMLLNNGKCPDGTEIISEHTLNLMKTPANKVKKCSQMWGIGVRVLTSEVNKLPRGCFGWSGAYGSHFWVDPVNRITAVYMKNSSYDGGAGNASAIEFERDVMKSFNKFKHL